MDRFLDTSRDFIGAEVIRDRQKNGKTMKLAYLAFDDDIKCEVFGNEAVYQGEKLVGLTTGGAYGHRVGYSLAFAYLDKDLTIEQGDEFTVLTTLGMRKAHAEMDAVYDAKNEKLRV
jgi:dimethylglycine dehydrogenase